MTEKEMFLSTWEREFATTLKILKQLPANKADYKPSAEKTKSAKGLAEVFVLELGVADGVMKGSIDFAAQAPTFATFADVLSAYEGMYRGRWYQK